MQWTLLKDESSLRLVSTAIDPMFDKSPLCHTGKHHADGENPPGIEASRLSILVPYQCQCDAATSLALEIA